MSQGRIGTQENRDRPEEEEVSAKWRKLKEITSGPQCKKTLGMTTFMREFLSLFLFFFNQPGGIVSLTGRKRKVKE